MGELKFEYSNSEYRNVTFPVLNSLEEKLEVRFEIQNPTSPRSVGLSDDSRELGINFSEISLKPY